LAALVLPVGCGSRNAKRKRKRPLLVLAVTLLLDRELKHREGEDDDLDLDAWRKSRFTAIVNQSEDVAARENPQLNLILSLKLGQKLELGRRRPNAHIPE
jgi:hypothetical protein